MADAIRTSAEAMEADALPRAHAVHCDPDVQTAENRPQAAAAARAGNRGKSPAHWAYERLVLYIQNFESQLDAEHEIAMGFTGGASGVLRIEGMGFFDPDIVTFYGTDPSGARTQMIQHVSQLNVLLRALPKAVAADAPRRIGFRLAQDLAEDLEAEGATDDA
ncbi:hypothetical protein DXV76_03940 [Rhodobacteraceae bacterium CCMM004]|nr:hypothetical protein DXV76_03940 [Rhodobacteraceae bacterium CCMM004]